MLIKVAWRNIWRSKMRTAVLILSIGFGLWAGIFSMGLMKGMSDQRILNTIATYVSHVQVHDRDYSLERDVAFAISDPASIASYLDTLTGVTAHSERMVLTAMASTAQGGTGVQLYGIEPDVERRVTDVAEKITKGSYFESKSKNQILIGQKLAKKLDVDVRSKIVLTFQDANTDLTAGAFRVVGIFETANSVWDETNVFVRRADLGTHFGSEPVHEVAIFLDAASRSDHVRDQLTERFPDLLSETWAEISPELGYTNDVLDQTMYIFVLIIMLAMAFGIVNSMLMAVLERKHELGMLLCIGMSKMRVFGMIVLETVFITSVGGPLGFLLALFSISHFGEAGIDLTIVEDGLKSFGMETVLYPALGGTYYLNITIMVMVTAILSAIYPARRAVKYNPAEAVRAI